MRAAMPGIGLILCFICGLAALADDDRAHVEGFVRGAEPDLRETVLQSELIGGAEFEAMLPDGVDLEIFSITEGGQRRLPGGRMTMAPTTGRAWIVALVDGHRAYAIRGFGRNDGARLVSHILAGRNRLATELLRRLGPYLLPESTVEPVRWSDVQENCVYGIREVQPVPVDVATALVLATDGSSGGEVVLLRSPLRGGRSIEILRVAACQ